MPRRLNIGRLKVPTYVAQIKKLFSELYPDSVPTDFQIYYTIMYFWDCIEESMCKDEIVAIPNFGKAYLQKKLTRVPGYSKDYYEQYYPKFKFSNSFIYRVRERKGSLTESEKRNFQKRRLFMSEMWRKRKEYMITKQPRKNLDSLSFLNNIFPDSVPEVYKKIKELGLNNYAELEQYYADRGEENPYTYSGYTDFTSKVEERLKDLPEETNSDLFSIVGNNGLQDIDLDDSVDTYIDVDIDINKDLWVD